MNSIVPSIQTFIYENNIEMQSKLHIDFYYHSFVYKICAI